MYLLDEAIALLDAFKMVIEFYDGALVQSVDRPPALFQES